jgi:hypothetical protein
MAFRSPQTQAKRARELAVKERRDRKRAKKAEAAARRADGPDVQVSEDGAADPASVEAQDEPEATPERDHGLLPR